MKRFVAIYLGSATALAQWKATDDQKRQEQEKAGMDAWMKWVKENELMPYLSNTYVNIIEVIEKYFDYHNQVN